MRPSCFLLVGEKAGFQWGLSHRLALGLVVIHVVVVVGSPQTGHKFGNRSLVILARTMGSLKTFLFPVNLKNQLQVL